MTGYITGSTCSILSFFFLFGWMHNSVPHLPNLKGSRIIWTIDRMSVNLLWFISFHFYSITEQSIALLVCTPIRCQLIRQMLFVTWVVYITRLSCPRSLMIFFAEQCFSKPWAVWNLSYQPSLWLCFCLLSCTHTYTHSTKQSYYMLLTMWQSFIGPVYDSIEAKCRCLEQGPIVWILSP